MELEKVINPALQQGQDSSIKPAHKDSSIFNYCFPSTEESKKKRPCCLPERRTQGPPDPSSSYHLLLFLAQRGSDTLPELLVDTFSLFI